MLPKSDLIQFFFITYYRQWDLMLEVFKKYSCYKMKILINYMLQNLMTGQCNHFGENLMKICWMVSEIFNAFLFFHVTFSTWKIEIKLCGKLHWCHILYIDLDSNTLIIICKKNLELVARKLTIRVFYSTWKRYKREHNLLGKNITFIVLLTPDWRSTGILRDLLI